MLICLLKMYKCLVFISVEVRNEEILQGNAREVKETFYHIIITEK